MFVSVILDIKNKEVNRFFDYKIPVIFADFIEIGMRVIVPFGNQKRLAYVILIKDKSEYECKELLEVLDITPIISKESFMLVDHLMKTTNCLFSQAFSVVIPSEMTIEYKKKVTWISKEEIELEIANNFNQKKEWNLKNKDMIFFPLLKRLEAKGKILIKTILKEKVAEKKECIYTINKDNNYKQLKKYSDRLDDLDKIDVIRKKDLLEVGLTESNITTLVNNDVLKREYCHVGREIDHSFELNDKVVTFNKEQKNVYDKITEKLNSNNTFLINGITGSGKTEIYLKLIEDVIKLNKTALILVPEITLIGPMAKRIKSRFSNVAIIHSSLSLGERYDEYIKIYKSEVNVVLGTRSAIFAPIQNLGIIIIDEEHDKSYLQTEKIQYDTKEIAKLRSSYNNIPLILGSATPSIESMYKALGKEYILLALTKRAQDMILPKIEFVDMGIELRNGNSSIFSRVLFEKIKDRLEKKEQVILLFNRKGYAQFVLCRNCGYVPKCKHCDISLTYYKKDNKLKCHYCGYEEKFDITCPTCKKHKVKEVGVGIELIEELTKKAFPNARILRMDANTTTKKGSHEKIWNDFHNELADILLGTQMVAKGLDFPKVTLVGVLMADLLLRVPSFKAMEDTYMLLKQATGRSGRHLLGEAVIQAYDINNFVIKVINEDYMKFYDEILHKRKLLNYEPFGKVNQIIISGDGYLKTYQKAFALSKEMIKLDYKILGPTPAIIGKIKDHYRFTITLKHNNDDFSELFEIISNFQKNNDIDVKFSKFLEML